MDQATRAGLFSLICEEFVGDDVLLRTSDKDNGSVAPLVMCLLPGRINRQPKRPKEETSMDELLASYRELDFHKNFRMKKDTFLKLVTAIEPFYKQKLSRGDSPLISVALALMVTLFYLSRQLSMQDIGKYFNISASVVCNECTAIIEILCNLATEYIKWPSINEVDIVSQQFEERAGIPGVTGAIDGCHIEFEPPKEHQHAYIDRKFNHSIILQGICTATKIFTDVSIGTPGRRHDTIALRNSSFFKKIEEHGPHSLFYDNEHHLAGDSAYLSRSWCLIPFEHNNNLTHQQRRYNYALSRTRIVIEHTFGLLKGRWRRLLHLFKRDVGKAVDVILACCVLHNFCYLNGDQVVTEMVDPNMVRGNRRRYNVESEAERIKGIQKRNSILRLFVG